ncbi:MAG: alcohol dehydrogenase catalytic domain-containing protein, partial [Dehalococcoidia bacterium]|nr:alcohol dehydrogenase catalytic domain-containing protein [Dehalococcoidia bacterium]
MSHKSACAAVKMGASTTEIQELPLPDLQRHPEGGLLRVEATGLCGADVMWYSRADEPTDQPAILGHHIVGVVEELSDRAASRLSLAVGDRILIEEYLPCGTCVLCREGDYRFCPQTALGDPGALRYGSTPVATEPGLWGGYSEYAFLHERSVWHRLSPETSTEQATLILPLSNGIQWVQWDGGIGYGDTVVIIGPGQHGLCGVIAAQAAGAANIVVLGLPGDEGRLELARELGAAFAGVDTAAALEMIRDATDGQLADAVLDMAAGTTATLEFGLDALRTGGRLLAGVWPAGATPIPLRKLATKRITLRPLRGHSYEAVDAARRAVERGNLPLDLLCT